jgi:hypothetical protein
MKRAIIMLMAAGLLAGATGCTCPHGRCGTGLINGSCQDAPEDCASCRGGCRNGNCASGYGDGSAASGAGGGQGAPNLGPPSAAVTYPYYTVRGPRDYFARNPQTIGP